jgi:hypothetical protein
MALLSSNYQTYLPYYQTLRTIYIKSTGPKREKTNSNIPHPPKKNRIVKTSNPTLYLPNYPSKNPFPSSIP